MDGKTYEALGLSRSLDQTDPGIVINGRANREIRNAATAPGDRQYNPCPEASVPEGTPRGTVRSFREWSGSKVYPGTKRDIWIYTPPGFDPTGPAPALAVFQDGAGYVNREGSVRAPAVFDTLLAASEMAPTVGVFVNPGQLESTPHQRSLEYDTVSDRYVSFVLDDVLPFVEAEIGCALTTDAARRTICGISSGGICAFNAAWWRPDAFGRVISHCGSFTNIRGGHNFPSMVRMTERKPIRVWMQSGLADADILYGNWPLANKEMAQALEFAGYDVKFVFGEGGHSLRHAGAVFGDTLRWLWRD
ncbi:MAG TPA: alpha/beta hydrolase-fold protein [Caulobacteraceae bacterium]|jgi:enterochelin esterase family protein